jgi:DnaK suppressor protein
MDLKILTQFKNVLFRLKKEIERKIKGFQKKPDFGSDVDPDEETGESEQFGSQLAIAQDYKERLTNVESALNKIKKGKYGICEKCGKEISLDVLKAAPESRLCKECKKKR